MEELTGHRVFIRTAELSSITKAAESLGLTRAAASRALMSLESELGAALFTRTTRHVALTAFGSQVLDTCKELVGLADQLKAEALHQSSAPTGTIRVACSVSFGQTYLAGALKRFLGEFPSINMELTLLDRPAHLLTDNIDLALEVTNTPEPGLIARRPPAGRSSAPPRRFSPTALPSPPRRISQNSRLSSAPGSGAGGSLSGREKVLKWK